MFANTLGLWALLSLIPFIILYLIKPKPQDKIIPSLMFLVKNQKNANKYSFLRKFIVNFLFFLQLLILILLSISVAAPFITIPYDVSLENTVIVIDASASMQAGDRFSKAISQAKKVLSGRNSIILAENIPLIVLEDESTEMAQDILAKLKPKATTTNLGDAMLLGKDILGDDPGRVVVISDFASIDGPDLLTVKKTLMAEDIVVDFIDISDKIDNVGIIRRDISKHNMKLYIKNYGNDKKEIILKLIKDGKEISRSNKLNVLGGSIETFEFDDVPAGTSEVILEPSDNFKIDNTLYLSTPEKKHINVVLITTEKNSNLELALSASKDVKLNVVDLFKSPAMNFNTNGENIKPYDHDIVIIHKINSAGDRGGMLLSGFTDITNFVKRGGNLIITAQDNSLNNNLNNLLEKLEMLKLNELDNEADRVCVEIINEFTKQFENDICFSSIGKHYSSSLRDNVVSIASTKDKQSIISYKEFEAGKVLFYGIIDDDSEFRSLPSYPIFWNSLINFLEDTEEVIEFNYKTGKILTLPEQKIKTPSGDLKTSKIIMDEVGYYEFDDKKISVNLLSEEESDLSSIEVDDESKEAEEILKTERKEHDFPIAPLILVIAFIFLIFETIYIKIRGDV